MDDGVRTEAYRTWNTVLHHLRGMRGAQGDSRYMSAIREVP